MGKAKGGDGASGGFNSQDEMIAKILDNASAISKKDFKKAVEEAKPALNVIRKDREDHTR